jgi:hypothetical protein
MEGSNQLPSKLIYGSSWTLIYNGSSGLKPDPGRLAYGSIQNLSNNSIWYSSYRFLITSKRGDSDAAHLDELELFGY